MNSNIYWTLDVEVHADRTNDAQALAAEMVNGARANEPGTLAYECSTTADGRLFHFYERYVDSAAAMTHLHTFGERYAGPFLEIFKPLRLVVFGSPDRPVRDALAGFEPINMFFKNGFCR